MDTTGRPDPLTSNLLLGGAALALVGNALHPFFAADVTASEVVGEAAGSALWVPLHLGLALTVAALTVAVVLVTHHFRGTAGAGLGQATATLAVLGGAVFTVQIGAIDGFVFPALDGAGLAGSEVAEAMWALDAGILSLVVLLYFGVTFVVFGLAMERAGMFATWIRRTAIVAGGVGILAGTLMFLDVAAGAAMIGFRLVALATTVVTVGLGLELRRAPATAVGPAPAAA